MKEHNKSAVDRLGPRYIEILALIAQGKNNTEIASVLGSTPNSIKSTTWYIRGVLGTRNRVETVLAYQAYMQAQEGK